MESTIAALPAYSQRVTPYTYFLLWCKQLVQLWCFFMEYDGEVLPHLLLMNNHHTPLLLSISLFLT